MAAENLSEKQKMTLWFVRLRWAAIVIILLITAVLIFPGRLNFPLFTVLLLAAIAATYNTIYPFLIRRFIFFSESIFFTYFRATVDLLIITLFIHFTGGIESPFTAMYLLDVAAISIFGYERIAYLLAAQASFFYLTMGFLETFGFIKHYQLITLPSALYLNYDYAVAKTLTIFFIAVLLIYIVSYLARHMREKQREIEILSDSKLDFINIVMHEAKSPLTSIMGYTDLLSSQNLGSITESQKEPLEIIKRQSKRILDMVNDLLNLARLESGKTKLEKKPTQLAEIAGHVVEEMRPSIDSKKLALIQEFSPDTPPIKMDEDKIAEVFTNLLSNAIKFSKEGGKIFLSVSYNEREVIFSIRDEGLGIDPIDFPHIFEKFYRASKESAERKGTGLGLALSKSIIEAHGGRMWVVSAGLGMGAVFSFALPR